jgi:polyisoprenoid-binding protein YceI
MTFKSDKVEMKDGKPAKVMGKLTLRGVTKPVVLEVEYRGAITDPYGKEKVGFSATTKINRKDFGVNWNKTLDKGGVAVSEEVTINIEGEAEAVAATAKK